MPNRLRPRNINRLNVARALKREGRVIVRDSMEPKKELVRILFGNPLFKKEFSYYERPGEDSRDKGNQIFIQG